MPNGQSDIINSSNARHRISSAKDWTNTSHRTTTKMCDSKGHAQENGKKERKKKINKVLRKVFHSIHLTMLPSRAQHTQIDISKSKTKNEVCVEVCIVKISKADKTMERTTIYALYIYILTNPFGNPLQAIVSLYLCEKCKYKRRWMHSSSRRLKITCACESVRPALLLEANNNNNNSKKTQNRRLSI